MSAEATPVTADHVRYVRQRTRAEDRFLLELKEAALAEGIPPIWICPEQASFIQILLRATGARRVVEVGTLAGYAAIWMARALPEDGKVTTIEIDPRHAAFASRWCARSDAGRRIEVVLGDAREVLKAMPDGSADAIFIDADKASYPAYLDEAARIVRRSGLVMADNAFAFGQLFDAAPTDREVPAVRLFNDLIASRKDLQAVITPFGDGCWVAVRL